MTEFTIIEARPWHCGQMARALRPEQYAAVSGLGFDPHRELRKWFDVSAFRRAWLIDGELAALGGVSGPVLSPSGLLWLALSRSAMRYPLAVMREARRQLADIMATRALLTITILDGDAAAKRLAVFLGFVPHAGFNPATSKYGRKSIAEYCERGEADRIQYGNGSLLVMRYARPFEEAA